MDLRSGVVVDGSSWYLAISGVLSALVIAVVVDRLGSVLRRSLALALERQAQLEESRDRLEQRQREIEELFGRLEASYEETFLALDREPLGVGRRMALEADGTARDPLSGR